jgi:outer membrane protein insertion porin family
LLLDETRQNLYRLRLFRIFSVLPESDAKTKKSPIPVKIYLEESPRISARYGIGYGTEDQFRTFIDLNYLCLFNTPSRLNLYLKHSALEPYYASLKWIFPEFPIQRSTVSVNPFISRNSEPGYETRSYGINVPVSYIFNDWLSATLTYYLEDVKQQIEEGDQEFPDMEEEDFPYYKSGILFSTILNNSKPKFSPTEGINFIAGFKINGHLFGSDFNYTRLWADFRNYHEAGNFVIAFRAMAGGIKSGDEMGFIPVEDRFYSGGSNSVRGWNRSELGPQRESGTPMGGKSIIESSLEFRFPLFWRFSGVAFIDAGNVWPGSYAYKLNDLAYAAGPGIRVETPIGPIRFDVGFPLWNMKKSPQFFISVGQAF